MIRTSGVPAPNLLYQAGRGSGVQAVRVEVTTNVAGQSRRRRSQRRRARRRYPAGRVSPPARGPLQRPGGLGYAAPTAYHSEALDGERGAVRPRARVVEQLRRSEFDRKHRCQIRRHTAPSLVGGGDGVRKRSRRRRCRTWCRQPYATSNWICLPCNISREPDRRPRRQGTAGGKGRRQTGGHVHRHRGRVDQQRCRRGAG